MSLVNETLPSEAAIDQGIEAMEADVAEMFGFGDAGDEGSTGAVVEGGAPPADDAPGAGGDQAPNPAPDTPPPADAGTPAAPAEGDQATPAGKPPVDPAAAAASIAPQPAPVDEAALRAQSLEAQVEALQARLAELQANPAAGTPASTGESGDASGQNAPPRYNLTLPQQVAEAIFSDEPQKQQAGIVHMMNSLAAIVHHNVRLEYRNELAQMIHQAQQQEQTVSNSAAVERGREEYYAAFPNHKNEMLTPLISAEAVRMTAEYPGLKWGPDYINALGARVNARIAAISPQPANTPPSEPAASIPSGMGAERREGSAVSGEDLIASVFS